VAQKFHFAILRIEVTRASRGLAAIAELLVQTVAQPGELEQWLKSQVPWSSVSPSYQKGLKRPSRGTERGILFRRNQGDAALSVVVLADLNYVEQFYFSIFSFH